MFHQDQPHATLTIGHLASPGPTLVLRAVGGGEGIQLQALDRVQLVPTLHGAHSLQGKERILSDSCEGRWQCLRDRHSWSQGRVGGLRERQKGEVLPQWESPEISVQELGLCLIIYSEQGTTRGNLSCVPKNNTSVHNLFAQVLLCLVFP